MEKNTALVWGIVIIAFITGTIYFYAVSNPILAPSSATATTTTP